MSSFLSFCNNANERSSNCVEHRALDQRFTHVVYPRRFNFRGHTVENDLLTSSNFSCEKNIENELLAII